MLFVDSDGVLEMADSDEPRCSLYRYRCSETEATRQGSVRVCCVVAALAQMVAALAQMVVRLAQMVAALAHMVAGLAHVVTALAHLAHMVAGLAHMVASLAHMVASLAHIIASLARACAPLARMRACKCYVRCPRVLYSRSLGAASAQMVVRLAQVVVRLAHRNDLFRDIPDASENEMTFRKQPVLLHFHALRALILIVSALHLSVSYTIVRRLKDGRFVKRESLISQKN